jgi:hypothetical protein
MRLPSSLTSIGLRALARIACIVLGQALLVPRPASAQLAFAEVKDVRIVYVEGSETYLVPYAARTFLNSLHFQKKLFDFTPSEKITVVLVDFQDGGGASTSVVPRNFVTVQAAPLSFAFETIAGNDRMNIIMNHELVHVAAMDQAAGRDRGFRRLFGGKVSPTSDQPESMLYFYLTTPRIAAPRWYHEGIATFMDTWMAGGLGRAQGGYDEMVFRSMVKDDARFFDPLGLVSEGTKIDFQLQVNSYLYGTRFMTWLARTYSPEQVIEWVARHDDSRAYYATQFRHVFGTSIEQAWARWVADEHAFQRQNLAAVRKYPLTPFTDLTPRALGSVSRGYFDPQSRTIYAGLNYPGVVGHVGAIHVDTGDVERLVNIKGPSVYTVTSLARDPESATLFYTTDNGAYRDLVSFDPKTRRTTLLQKDLRVAELVFDPIDQSLWGVRSLNGLCTLVRIPKPYRDWNQIYTWPYGTVVYDLDISPDGTKLSASFGEISGKQNVRILSIEAVRRGDLTPIAQFDFGTAVPNNFVFSPDGRFLYGSSYYTGASNIFRYEIATTKLDAVTNAETGFFRPIPLGGDDLIVFRYSGAGFVPARLHATPLEDVSAITFLGERLAEERPVIKTWNVGSPAAIDYDAMPKQTGVYRLSGGLRLESLYPIAQGYKDAPAVGVRFNFSDHVQLNRLNLSASFSPETTLPSSERVHLAAGYDRYDWRARAALNSADFYDLFGPTKVGRKGYYGLVGHKSLLVFDEPRRLELDLSGSIAGNLDRLPEYQNIAVDVDHLYSVDSRLTYSDLRHSLGYVDEETGTQWSGVVQGRSVGGSVVPRVYGTYDRGFALPTIGHSSIWVRSAAGFSPSDPANPFANYFFGAFGNNYIDHGEEHRYREYYAFPGLDLNAIGGRNFVKSIAEWNLPPWRFSRVGTPGFYASWLRPSVFVGGLATNLDAAPARTTATDFGGQIDVRVMMLSELEMTVSVGGAVAFARDHAPRHEAMVSLKILR